jgi:uncharacterized surface protein with fasciclin (FAS1) repeats
MPTSRHFAHPSRALVASLAVMFIMPCFCESAVIVRPSRLRISVSNSSSYPPIDETLYHIIKDNEGTFSQLHSYIKQAPDIELQLKSLGADVTFFAPENVAFGRMTPENIALFESDISTHLKYHLLPRVVTEKDMRDGTQEQTEQGSNVHITVQGALRDVWINDAYILDGDHLVTNGALQRLFC